MEHVVQLNKEIKPLQKIEQGLLALGINRFSKSSTGIYE